MLHHLVLANAGSDGRLPDAACPERRTAQRFFGTSEELRPLTLLQYTAIDVASA